MNFWLVLAVNSITFGGLLFLLSAGFSLIFGLMRIPNLTHGSLFMLGAYFGATFIGGYLGAAVRISGSRRSWPRCWWRPSARVVERLLLRQLPGQPLAQVLVTLGISFMAADFCLMVWGGDPINVATPAASAASCALGPAVFPLYRLAIIVIAVVIARRALAAARPHAARRHDPRRRRRSRHGAGGRHPRVAAVHHRVRARRRPGRPSPASSARPILSVYPGLDQDMLPLALVVVILGGTGSLLGSFVGSIIVGFIYNFGQALLPELAYFVLFLPMLLVLLLRPQGLFGRFVP